MLMCVYCCNTGTFTGVKGIAEVEAPIRMPPGESLGDMDGLMLRLAADSRPYSIYLRTGEDRPCKFDLSSLCCSRGSCI